MKRTRTGYFFAFAAIAMLLGCKKETREDPTPVAPGKSIEKLKAWYEASAAETRSRTVQVNGKGTEVSETADWNEARYFGETNLTITPVKIGKLKAEAPVYKYLAAKNNSNGELTEVNYYRVFAGKEKPSSNSLKLNNVTYTSKIIAGKNVPADFTGALLKYTNNNVLLVTTNYEKGVVTSVKEQKQNGPGEISEGVAPVECSSFIVDSWWVTYYDGVIISIEYLYSTTYTNCPQEGGGSGGGHNEPPVTCESLLAEMVASASESSEFKSETFINETATTRTALYSWYCVTSWTGWKVYSVERALHIKTNNPDPNLQWQFYSVIHDGIGIIGSLLGGVLDATVTSSQFTLTPYTMHVYLGVKVKYTLDCSFPLTVTLSYTPHKIFNINQGQL